MGTTPTTAQTTETTQITAAVAPHTTDTRFFFQLGFSPTLEILKEEGEDIDGKLQSLPIYQSLSYKTLENSPCERDDVEFVRLPPSLATEEYMIDEKPSQLAPFVCARCGKVAKLIFSSSTSDGMMGIEHGTWICSDSHCGLKKTQYYRGYGYIV